MWKRYSSIAAGLLVTVGCGGAISAELFDARESVETAGQSVAARLEPDELHRARETLARAEAASDGSREEQTLAYLADRQARLAMAHAQARSLQMRAERDEEQHRRLLEEEAIAQRRTIESQQRAFAEVQEELGQVRDELAERGDILDQRSQELRAREEQLEQRLAELSQAREERAAAEQRAEDAMARVRELMQTREEEHETIITLSGQILFETDRADLRVTAEDRLSAVADALRSEGDQTAVRIVGHTDTRGSTEHNQRLSQQRAASVRDFLVSQGIAPARLEIEGRGEASPIAPNDTPEGRANNRRVEIHVQRPRGEDR